MIKPRERFHFDPPIQGKEDWMLELVDLEVYNSVFNITEETNKFKLFKYPDGNSVGVSNEKVRNEIYKDLENTDITATDLQDDIIAPIIAEEYRNQVTKRMNDVIYMRILAIYANSIFQDFESFLRTEIDLVEEAIRLVLDEYISSFITYEIKPGIYAFKEISEAFLKILQPENELLKNSVGIEYDDITRKIKLVVRPGIIAIKFDEQSFLSTILGYSRHWDYKH